MRDTGTGEVLERMIVPAMQRGGYDAATQVDIGTRPGGGRHRVDAVARREGRSILVSLKWQQVPGTAEQKVPFEVICLGEAMRSGSYDGAYLVLGGPGWKLREFFTGGGLSGHLVDAGAVRIVSLESFIALANQGRL
ncbi:MAG TPA: PD-(D/E)XK nuclease superfamily protein [Candidatus Polarisedimenticolia bacterium]|nr:PD-(D/E)XK nuclease superfamily protein [Candidatus Polarisedimenticolia bacterium]